MGKVHTILSMYVEVMKKRIFREIPEEVKNKAIREIEISIKSNPEVFGLDFALVGMFIGIFTSQFQIMQKRIPLRNLFIILGVVAVSFFVLLTVVSQSLAVLFATLLGCTMGVILDGQ